MVCLALYLASLPIKYDVSRADIIIKVPSGTVVVTHLFVKKIVIKKT